MEPSSSYSVGSGQGTEAPGLGRSRALDETQPGYELECNTVKQWTKRIRSARTTFEPDFKRMRKNMGMANSLQWLSQKNLQSELYVANWINREVNQKVASLYARDPKAVAKRRKRLDYVLWDGNPQTAMLAQMSMQQGQVLGMVNPQAAALAADIAHGNQWQDMLDRVSQTLEIGYQYQCDTQQPEFKYQMKQLVRRVVITGVGYVRLSFARIDETPVQEEGADASLPMRVKRAKDILSSLEDQSLDPTNPALTELQSLFASIQASASTQAESIEERLEFDFPSATSVIVDPRCRALKGFLGARWIAQQYIVPVSFIEAYFETKLPLDGDLVTYAEDGIPEPKDKAKKDEAFEPLACLWEVFDYDTKTSFFIVDGYKMFVTQPAPVEPQTSRFWPIFALTFNDAEVEPGEDVHIYPPSDVDLVWHIQKEWNRSRQALREHREQNAPFYVAKAGWLTKEDKEKLGNHESGEVVELQGAPTDGDLSKALVAFRPAPIDPAVYQSTPYVEDIFRVLGQQNTVEPPRNVAATPAVIQEQLRVSGVNSNVDDLDDLLSDLAKAGGEIMLREFSPMTMKRIVGVGAVWPDQQREDFLNEIYLTIVASSSGRPNKAVEIANFERIAPLMLNAGANPWGVIEEAVKRLDDRLEPAKFAPVMPPSPVPAEKPKGDGAQKPGQSGQPLQQNMAQQPVPLPGQPMQAPGTQA